MVAAEDWGQVSPESEAEHKEDQVGRPAFALGLEQRLAAANAVEAVVLVKEWDWEAE